MSLYDQKSKFLKSRQLRAIPGIASSNKLIEREREERATKRPRKESSSESEPENDSREESQSRVRLGHFYGYRGLC